MFKENETSASNTCLTVFSYILKKQHYFKNLTYIAENVVSLPIILELTFRM
jgi:hypothetical protein